MMTCPTRPASTTLAHLVYHMKRGGPCGTLSSPRKPSNPACQLPSSPSSATTSRMSTSTWQYNCWLKRSAHFTVRRSRYTPVLTATRTGIATGLIPQRQGRLGYRGTRPRDTQGARSQGPSRGAGSPARPAARRASATAQRRTTKRAKNQTSQSPHANRRRRTPRQRHRRQSARRTELRHETWKTYATKDGTQRRPDTTNSYQAA